MNYELPNEITSSVCWFLTSSSNITAYPTRRIRETWVRSGTKWYKQNRQVSNNYDYDISTYTCMNGKDIEYEYSYVEPIYQYISAIIAFTAIILAFWLIIYRLFKGGSKW